MALSMIMEADERSTLLMHRASQPREIRRSTWLFWVFWLPLASMISNFTLIPVSCSYSFALSSRPERRVPMKVSSPR